MDGTCLLIRNSNQSKCGSLLHRLASQFSIKNNQYPKNIVNASDILSNHLNMITGQIKETVSRRRAVITPKRRKETIHLHHDQQEDKLCTRWQRSDLLLLQYKKGHIIPECPDKTTIKKKYCFIRKTRLNTQAEQQQQQQQQQQ